MSRGDFVSKSVDALEIAWPKKEKMDRMVAKHVMNKIGYTIRQTATESAWRRFDNAAKYKPMRRLIEADLLEDENSVDEGEYERLSNVNHIEGDTQLEDIVDEMSEGSQVLSPSRVKSESEADEPISGTNLCSSITSSLAYTNTSTLRFLCVTELIELMLFYLTFSDWDPANALPSRSQKYNSILNAWSSCRLFKTIIESSPHIGLYTSRGLKNFVPRRLKDHDPPCGMANCINPHLPTWTNLMVHPLLSAGKGTLFTQYSKVAATHRDFENHWDSSKAVKVVPPSVDSHETFKIILINEGILVAYRPSYLAKLSSSALYYDMHVTIPAVRHLNMNRDRAQYRPIPWIHGPPRYVWEKKTNSGGMPLKTATFWKSTPEIVDKQGVKVGPLLEKSKLVGFEPRKVSWVMVVWEIVR